MENRIGRPAVHQPVDQRAGSDHVTAEYADGLGEGADLDVDLAVQAEVVDGAAPVAAHDARCVRVVNHGDAAVFLGEFDELVEFGDVAVHAEHTVGNHEFAVVFFAFAGLEFFLEVGHIAVFVDALVGARDADAVDDAGVVQLIAEYDAALVQDRRGRAGVGSVAGLVKQTGLAFFEVGYLGLEVEVDLHRAGDGADRAGACAVFLGVFDRTFDDLGVVAEAEVVVGRKVDDLFVVVDAHGLVRAVEGARPVVQAVLLEVVDHPTQIIKIAHGILHKLFMMFRFGSPAAQRRAFLRAAIHNSGNKYLNTR